MKKQIFTAFVLGLVLMGCNKNSGNKSILIKESETSEVSDNNGKTDSADDSHLQETVNGQTTTEESFLYKGLDKSLAKIIFTNKPKENTITIIANDKKFILDKKGETKGETTYERSGIKAVVKGDSINLIQDQNVIPLVKVKM